MLATTNKETMSHTEIATLCNKRSDSVKRTMNSLVAKGVIKLTQTVEVNHLKQSVTVYNVNERDSYIVVAQLSPEFTAFLVDEWQKRKQPVEPSWLLSLSPEAKIAIADLSQQRDEAIKTKAQINDKRTATLMNKASQDSKRIKKLESQVQAEGTHRSMLAEKIPTHIHIKGERKQVATILRNISDDMELPRQKVSCARYGSVWAYHVDVIAQFKDMYL